MCQLNLNYLMRLEILSEFGAYGTTSPRRRGELVQAFEDRLAAWHKEEEIYLKPWVSQSIADLGEDVSEEYSALGGEPIDINGTEWGEPLDIYEDAEDEDEDADETTSSPESKGKRKARSEPQGDDTEKHKKSRKRRTKASTRPSAEPSDIPDDDDDNLLERVQRVKIALPSTFKKTVREHSSLAVALRIEHRMWERFAIHNLDEVRAHLITAFGAAAVKKMVSNQTLSTRAHNAIKHKWKLVYTAANIYRQSRKKLLILGLADNDPHLRELRRTDLRAFTAFTAEEDMVLRDKQKKKGSDKERGRNRMPSWIWEKWDFIQKGSSPELKEFFLEGEYILSRVRRYF